MEPYPYRVTASPRPQPRLEPAVFPWGLLGLAVAQFFMARTAILGELHPLGTAVYAAYLVASKERVWPLALAMVGGTATVTPGAMLDTLFLSLALLPLRFYGRVFHAPWVIVSWVTGMHWLVRGMLWLARGGEAESLLAVIVFEGLLAGGCSLGFAKVIDAPRRARGWPALSGDQAVWVFVGILGILGGLQGWGRGGLSLQGIAQVAAVMLAASTGGAGAGASMGLVAGLVPALTGAQATASPAVVFGLSGLLAGFFSGLKKPGVILGFLLGNLLLSVYFPARIDLVHHLEASVVGALIFLVIPAYWINALPFVLPLPEAVAAYRRENEVLFQEQVKIRLGQLAAVFQELHQAFSRPAAPAAEPPRLTEEEILQICAGCPGYRSCWDAAPPVAYHDLGRLLVRARQGAVTEAEIGSELRQRCLRPRELVAAAGRLAREYHQRQFWADQVEQARSLVAAQVAGVGEIMRDLGEHWSLAAAGPAAREAELVGRLQRLGLPVTGLELVAAGNNTWQVNLRRKRCEDTTECRRLMLPVLEDWLGYPLVADDSGCPWKIGGRECRVTFWPASPLAVDAGLAQISRSGSAFCGDCMVAKMLAPGRYLAALSDGMGMGYRAAQESRATIHMFSSLLAAGFSRQVAINTINCVLRLRSPEEMFATLDAALIDLVTGQTEVVKIGAAPSFLVSADKVEVVESTVPPVGILETPEVEVITRHLQPGNLLAMVSDGLLGAGPGRPPNHAWLVEALAQCSRLDAQGVADLLLRQAQALYGPAARDDMSVLVVRVTKADE